MIAVACAAELKTAALWKCQNREPDKASPATDRNLAVLAQGGSSA
jgi:hypothetical protein